jgi:hypothetical protein
VDLGGTPSVRTVTVRNAGTALLTGLALTKDGANVGDHSVEALSTSSLAPEASISLDVTFASIGTGSAAGLNCGAA